jgi:hypothetical protein
MIKMEHLKQAVDQLNVIFEQVKIQQAELMAKMTPEQLAMVAPIQSDITNALDALKKGDVDSINKLQKKYANIDKQ